MTYHIQMTYIPHITDQGQFLLWLTHKDGSPSTELSVSEWRESLLESEWSSLFANENTLSTHSFTSEYLDKTVELHGLLVPMWPIFSFLQYELEPTQVLDKFHFGESFFFWQKLASGVNILLQQGHYYPSLLSLEKEDKVYYFSQWMLSRRLLTSLKIYQEWLSSIPSIILSIEDLAHVPIRQWLDALLDSWTDQIIRKTISPQYTSYLKQDLAEHRVEEQDLFSRWHTSLFRSENRFFFISSNESTFSRMRDLEQHIEKWLHKLINEHTQSTTSALLPYKQLQLQAFLEPISLLLQFEPMDPVEGDLFDTWVEWRVNLQVEAIQENKSLILDVSELWNLHSHAKDWLLTKVKELSQLDRRFATLLTHQESVPSNLSFTGEEVAVFFQKDLAHLENHNIYPTFPNWLKWNSWTESNVDIHLQTAVEGDSAFGLSSLVKFNWKISIGDVSLTVDEFLKLVHEQKRFIKLGGEWVELPLEKLLDAYQEMSQLDGYIGKKGRMSDLLHLSIEDKRRSRRHLQIEVDPRANSYLQNLLGKPNESLDIPSTFKGKLRPYQYHGFTWLSFLQERGIGACLADDMGLGKTVQAIVYLLSLEEKEQVNKQPAPALIICPTSLIGNWQRELHVFAPSLRVYAHHGPDRMTDEEFQIKKTDYDVMITSYSLIVRDNSWMGMLVWPIIIIDEAQAIKNPLTKQSRLIRQLHANHRIALTGTPMENRLDELWSIMDFLNPGYLGSLRRFRQQFAIPIEKQKNTEKAQLLKSLIQPFILRRTKTDPTIITDLPDKIEKKEICHLSSEQASLYQSIVDELMVKMGSAKGLERKGLILSALIRLKQVCDHPFLLVKQAPVEANHSGKLYRFFELIKIIFEQNQSALVFTQYVKMGEILNEQLKKFYPTCPVFFLHGGLPSHKREELIESFRKHKDQPALFILSLKAGGLGLNLTEANHVIHYDRWWNPAVEDQATDRAYRIGQQKNVHVYKLISEGTLEEGIDQLIDKKRGLTDQVIGNEEGWVTELTDEEVYQLIRLRERVKA
jgi:SNF2 family DNA or RNA helicase